MLEDNALRQLDQVFMHKLQSQVPRSFIALNKSDTSLRKERKSYKAQGTKTRN